MRGTPSDVMSTRCGRNWNELLASFDSRSALHTSKCASSELRCRSNWTLSATSVMRVIAARQWVTREERLTRVAGQRVAHFVVRPLCLGQLVRDSVVDFDNFFLSVLVEREESVRCQVVADDFRWKHMKSYEAQ